jgi:dihydroneopterin aldolase
MHNASYYREQAERAARLARSQTRRDVEELLQRVAQDYADLAEDLENGAVEIRHPELMPQRQRAR